MSVVRMSKQMNSLIVRCDKLVETFSHKDDLYVISFSSLQYASMLSNQKCRLHAAYTCTVCAGNGRWCRLDIGSSSYFVGYCNIFHSQVESCCRGPDLSHLTAHFSRLRKPTSGRPLRVESAGPNVAIFTVPVIAAIRAVQIIDVPVAKPPVTAISVVFSCSRCHSRTILRLVFQCKMSDAQGPR